MPSTVSALHSPTLSSNPMLLLVGGMIAASLWFAVNVAVPELQRSGASLFALRIVVNLLLLSGAWAGLKRTSLSVSERIWTWAALAIPLTLWFGGTWSMVAHGLLRPGAFRLPLLPLLVVVPTSIVMVLVLRSRRIGLLLDAVPTTWLIGIQFYRVVGGVFFLGWIAGATPAVFAFPAGAGDVVTGLMALPVAAIVASRQPGSRQAAIRWNLFGMGDLVLALTLGALTAPGPLQSLALGHPNLMIGTFPTAIIPAFTVPCSLVLHALSLRQWLRRGRLAVPDAV